MSVANAFDRAEAGFGPAAILVNNSGTARSAKFDAMSRELWDATIAANLTSTYLCTTRGLRP